jgi:hypothetical protein
MDHAIHPLIKKYYDHNDSNVDMIFDHTLFWYYVLYIIGSYVIDENCSEVRSRTMQLNNNVIDRIFCGYWILYTIDIEYGDT